MHRRMRADNSALPLLGADCGKVAGTLRRAVRRSGNQPHSRRVVCTQKRKSQILLSQTTELVALQVLAWGLATADRTAAFIAPRSGGISPNGPISREKRVVPVAETVAAD